MKHLPTIQQLEQRHPQWFNDESMTFFNSKIESGIIPNLSAAYFITSERPDTGDKKMFSIRVEEFDRIKTVGEFRQFKSFRSAMAFLQVYDKGVEDNSRRIDAELKLHSHRVNGGV